jgi:hypothetical protein
MIVRAKMSLQNSSRGEKGTEVFLGAVYEGSNELQQVSENAIFGEATPSGSLSLHGDFSEFPFRRGEDGECPEFYIDLVPSGRTQPGGSFILAVPVRMAFYSGPSYQGSTISSFRYVSDGPISVNLYLGIANPDAVKSLAQMDQARMVIRLCDGRRSAAEIAVLEKMLADETAAAKQGVPSWCKDTTPEEWLERCTHSTRRKLARARGTKDLVQ